MLVLFLLAALPNCDELKRLPEVASVESTAVENPEHRIIHILNWHYVSREDHSLDADPDEYEAFLDQVESMQIEQMAFLRRLKVRRVFYEGLTEKDKPAFVQRAITLKKMGRLRIDDPIDQLLAGFRREDELQLGSPGRLMMSSDIDEVLPSDEAGAMERANPIKDGKIIFDEKANEEREDATVRLLLREKETILIMGGAHDLQNNVPAGVEYVRVKLKKYASITLQ